MRAEQHALRIDEIPSWVFCKFQLVIFCQLAKSLTIGKVTKVDFANWLYVIDFLSIGSTSVAERGTGRVTQILWAGITFSTIFSFDQKPSSMIFRRYKFALLTTCQWLILDDKSDEKFVLFDGPIDTSWIESMNSLMDDNKILTLVNGERISLKKQVVLVFESDNLSNASPATVSRAGILFCHANDLSPTVIFQSWLKEKFSPVRQIFCTLRKLFEENFRTFNRC